MQFKKVGFQRKSKWQTGRSADCGIISDINVLGMIKEIYQDQLHDNRKKGNQNLLAFFLSFILIYTSI